MRRAISGKCSRGWNRPSSTCQLQLSEAPGTVAPDQYQRNTVQRFATQHGRIASSLISPARRRGARLLLELVPEFD